MPRLSYKSPPPDTRSEIGTIRKSWHSRVSIALVYPNRYHVGMSNLGFQTLYRLFNSYDHVVCERAFFPEGKWPQSGRLKTMESGRLIAAADIIAFSLSFENDYPHLLTILDGTGIPLRTDLRNGDHPLIIAGGVACFLNPEPIAAFIDCFLIGEAEGILPRFFDIFETDSNKQDVLKNLARNVPGAYVPAFYQTRYKDDGTLESFEPLKDVPQKIKRIGG